MDEQLIRTAASLIFFVVLIVLSVYLFIGNDSIEDKVKRKKTEQIAMMKEFSNLASIAWQYYKKPVKFDGGGNSFVNWEIPSNFKTTKTGKYVIKKITTQEVTIVGMSNNLNFHMILTLNSDGLVVLK